MKTIRAVYRKVQVVSVIKMEGISNFRLFDFYPHGYGYSSSPHYATSTPPGSGSLVVAIELRVYPTQGSLLGPVSVGDRSDRD
jgi:hypothetical protein